MIVLEERSVSDIGASSSLHYSVRVYVLSTWKTRTSVPLEMTGYHILEGVTTSPFI